MRNIDEVYEELNRLKEILDNLGDPCTCGCDSDTFDYYNTKIRTLMWVLNV